MKFFFVLLLTFISIGESLSQSVDSIQENPITKYSLLMENAMNTGQWDNVLTYGDTLYSLSKQADSTRHMLWSQMYIGKVNVIKGDYSKAHLNYNECLKLMDRCNCKNDFIERLYMSFHVLSVLENNQDSIQKYTNLIDNLPCTEALVVVKDYLARQLLVADQPQEALLQAKNNLLCARSLEAESLVTAGLSCIGVIYIRTKDYKQALLYMDSTLAMAELLKDTLSIYSTYGYLGGINNALANDSKALEWFKKALEIIEPIYYNEKNIFAKAKMMLGGTYNHIANTYENLAIEENTQKYEDSIQYYYQKSLEVGYETLDYQSMTQVMISLAGKIINSGQNYQAAIDSLDKAYKIAPRYANWELIKYLIYSKKGVALTGLKQFEAAKYYLDSAEIIAHTLSDSSIQLIGVYDNQKNLYLVQENYKKAYEYETLANGLKEKLQKEQEQKTLTDFEVKYETEQVRQQNNLLSKDRDIQELRAERNQRLIYVGLILFVLIVIIFILLVLQFRTKAFYLTQKLNYQFLRNQMNPHFIFNSLGAIQSIVYKKKPIEAVEYIASFGELMRAILDNSSEEYISLDKEIQWLENYLKLQLLRFEDQFDYTIHVDAAIDVEDTMIPPMLTQPFIENALEHGLKNIDYRGDLQVNINIHDNVLHIDILDNGIGLEAGKKNIQDSQHKSRATQITEKRLKFLNKKQAANIYFSIEPNEGKGTRVSFRIPFISKF